MFATDEQVQRFVEQEISHALSGAIEQQARYAGGWVAYLDHLAKDNSTAWQRAKDGKEREQLHRRGLAIGRARQLVGAVLCNVMRDVGANVGTMLEREYPGQIGRTLAAKLRVVDVLEYHRDGTTII